MKFTLVLSLFLTAAAATAEDGFFLKVSSSDSSLDGKYLSPDGVKESYYKACYVGNKPAEQDVFTYDQSQGLFQYHYENALWSMVFENDNKLDSNMQTLNVFVMNYDSPFGFDDSSDSTALTFQGHSGYWYACSNFVFSYDGTNSDYVSSDTVTSDYGMPAIAYYESGAPGTCTPITIHKE
jgi:hypothetical protein